MTGSWAPAPPSVVDRGLPQAPAAVRLRVLHVITRLDAGAGGNTLLSAVGMDRTRYEVDIAGGPGGSLWDEARRQGVATHVIRSLRREVAPLDDLRALVALVRLLRRERFAVVHLHSAKAGVLGRLAAALCRTPVVVYSLHGRDPWWPAADGQGTELADAMGRGLRAFLLVERALRHLTHRFVAVSPTVARDAVLARVATPGRVDVAASAVDLDRLAAAAEPDALAALGLGPVGPVVGTVGRLDAQKAPLDFVRMAAAVRRRRPDVRFVMIGEGELAGQVRELATELGVEVLLAGQRADVTALVPAFDVFVISSLYEGVGRALTEALAAARPVVATAVDGVVDVVVPGATGLLAPVREPDALAERVCWLLDHPADAARMGAQARAYVRSLFAPERLCATLDRVYAQALGLDPLPAHDAPAPAVPLARTGAALLTGTVADGRA